MFLTAMQCRELQLGTKAYAGAMILREKVLRRPLGFTFTKEELDDEPRCMHLGCFEGEQLIAVLLLMPLDSETVKMRQVAVDPSQQRTGIGRKLIDFAESFARARGFRKIVAHARGTALEFYERIGYHTEGDEFLENTIPHWFVWKELV